MKITEDLKAFVSGGETAKTIATVLLNPCFHSVCLFRLSSFFYRIHLAIISKIIWYINRLLFHVDIDYRADLAGGFVLVHGLGTVIGCETRSLGHLTVYQGVTIGGCGRTRVDENGKIWGQPLLENNVTIYTGASLFGPIVVSEGAKIKAGQIVSEDI